MIFDLIFRLAGAYDTENLAPVTQAASVTDKQRRIMFEHFLGEFFEPWLSFFCSYFPSDPTSNPHQSSFFKFHILSPQSNVKPHVFFHKSMETSRLLQFPLLAPSKNNLSKHEQQRLTVCFGRR
jgi:hypothetical protein